MFASNARIALAALSRNRMRTVLCALGIGIGIAAVICTAALGEAGSGRVEAQMDALGEDFLWIRGGSRNVAGVRTGAGGVRTLTAADAAAVSDLPEVVDCSPLISGRQQIIAGGRNWNTRYQAVLPSYFQIRRRAASAGSLFTTDDQARGARVLVLGPSVAERLFGHENPIGQTVRMNRFPFRIVGVLSTRGADRAGVDRDDAVFLPLSAATRSLDRRTWVNDVMCGVRSPDQMQAAEQQAAVLLRIRHDIPLDDADDFEIEQPLASLAIRAETARTMSTLLLSVGAISLVVGGIGIMNIMLVSVTERRREIGVRLAIGARVGDIRQQFLLESAILGAAGALLGIGTGWAGAWVLSWTFGWPTVVTTEAVALAASTALVASLAFGYYPARRASMLDPMTAMRTEP